MPDQGDHMSVGVHFGDSDENSASFKVVPVKDETGHQVKVLNWGGRLIIIRIDRSRESKF